MKHAYVTLLLPVPNAPSFEQLTAADTALSAVARAHEIIVVTPHESSPPNLSTLALTGPVSVVTTHVRATPDDAVMAGLSRAVGDFVIEWRGQLSDITPENLSAFMSPTDSGTELVEVGNGDSSRFSRWFYRVANTFRSQKFPIRKTAARVYSRHAVGRVLHESAMQAHLNVTVAELPVTRVYLPSRVNMYERHSFVSRVREGVSLLLRGTHFGSVLPLVLAVVSAAFGIGAAIYALTFLIVSGRTPEGWTTLMVVIGLGQAAILTMLALMWARVDALMKGLSRSRDATATVTVYAPLSAEPDR